MSTPDATPAIERFHCNSCQQNTRHFIQGEYEKTDDDQESVWMKYRMLIVECCGCESLSLVKRTLFSEDIEPTGYDQAGEIDYNEPWEEFIYPPVTYRRPPDWFDDLPDEVMRNIFAEIYSALHAESLYLATFGSRTLIDRLIVLTVGDKGNFPKGLKALKDQGKLSTHEEEILRPVINAGNAAAHRGWAPTKELLAIILDTVEGLMLRLLVLPQLAEELEDAVPGRHQKPAPAAIRTSYLAKIETAPDALRAVYDNLAAFIKSLGNDVTLHPQKHYVAFRRNRNFACVQIYPQKRVIRVYLNLDPDQVADDASLADIDPALLRDVRQIGHYGTGDLELTIKSKKDIENALELIGASYQIS